MQLSSDPHNTKKTKSYHTNVSLIRLQHHNTLIRFINFCKYFNRYAITFYGRILGGGFQL